MTIFQRDDVSNLGENRGTTIIVVVCVMSALSAITVALRFVARWRIHAPIQWDDWLCLPALVH